MFEGWQNTPCDHLCFETDGEIEQFAIPTSTQYHYSTLNKVQQLKFSSNDLHC